MTPQQRRIGLKGHCAELGSWGLGLGGAVPGLAVPASPPRNGPRTPVDRRARGQGAGLGAREKPVRHLLGHLPEGPRGLPAVSPPVCSQPTGWAPGPSAASAWPGGCEPAGGTTCPGVLAGWAAPRAVNASPGSGWQTPLKWGCSQAPQAGVHCALGWSAKEEQVAGDHCLWPRPGTTQEWPQWPHEEARSEPGRPGCL